MATLTPDELYKLYAVKRTQVEMMKDRGYLIPETESKIFLTPETESKIFLTPDGRRISVSDDTLLAFARSYQRGKPLSHDMLTTSYTNSNNDIAFVYYTSKAIKANHGVNEVALFVKEALKSRASLAIIITQAGFTPDAKKRLAEIIEPKIQVFFDHQLYINPTKHILVPKHTKLSDDERAALLKQSHIKPSSFPAMCIDDPITVYYGWNSGNIIRIERINLATTRTMATSNLSYRIVSKNKIIQHKPKAKTK